MTLIYRDEKFLLHQTGLHPECPGRLEAIHSRLTESGLLEACVEQKFKPASDEDILRVHTEQHLSRIREFAKAGGGRIEADTVMSVQSADVAALAAGAAVDAVLKCRQRKGHERIVSGTTSRTSCVTSRANGILSVRECSDRRTRRRPAIWP